MRITCVWEMLPSFQLRITHHISPNRINTSTTSTTRIIQYPLSPHTQSSEKKSHTLSFKKLKQIAFPTYSSPSLPHSPNVTIPRNGIPDHFLRNSHTPSSLPISQQTRSQNNRLFEYITLLNQLLHLPVVFVRDV